MEMDGTNTSELKLFEFKRHKKLFLLLCTVILWISALITYYIPGFNYVLVASLNALRTDALFGWFWYNYTLYMLYIFLIPIIILYIMSFKVDQLKPYRLVLFLSMITTAIGTPIVDPFMKNLFAIPRPWIAYPDINSLYYVPGFSFPSGHSFQSFSTTLPIIICLLTSAEKVKRNWKKVILATILLILALILAISRVLAGVHYISDILFGIGFAIFLVVILASVIQWLLKNNYLNVQNEKWYALVSILILIINTIFIR